jgi:hypothetical protein
MDKNLIAKVCHEANKGICETAGDMSQKSWEEAAEWQKEATINNVTHHIMNPNETAEASHLAWVKDKLNAGWKYGPIKDPEKKEHPCLVPYQELPFEQRVKDVVFSVIVNQLKKL